MGFGHAAKKAQRAQTIGLPFVLYVLFCWLVGWDLHDGRELDHLVNGPHFVNHLFVLFDR